MGSLDLKREGERNFLLVHGFSIEITGESSGNGNQSS